MPIVKESTVYSAGSGTGSVKTTVPTFIAEMLALKPHDMLVWSMEPGSGEVRVTKKPERKSSKRS